MSTAFRYRETECSACGWDGYANLASGSFGQDPRLLRTERLRWLNNLSGKLTVPPTLFRKVEKLFGRGRWTPCDLGLCKNDLKAKIAASETCGFSPFFEKLFGRQDATFRHSPPFFIPQNPRAPP
jgi:hypothetical protein